MKNSFIQLGFEQKGFNEEKKSLKIKGFASTKNTDRYGDVVEPFAFAKSIELFMTNPVMLLQHNKDKPIGKFTKLAMTIEGLEVEGEVLHNDDGVIDKIKSGVLQAFSIGYIPKKWEIRNPEGILVANEEGMQNGFSWEAKWNKDNTRTITELELLEISIVSIPANAHSLFGIEASTKSFFDSLEKDWRERLQESKQEESENTNIPPSGDELVDTDNVANEVISENFSENSDNSEVENTPESESEKSFGSDEKNISENDNEISHENILESKEYKELLAQKEQIAEIAKNAVIELEKTLAENTKLKNILQNTPVRKGLVNISGTYEPKQKGFIEKLMDEANKI